MPIATQIFAELAVFVVQLPEEALKVVVCAEASCFFTVVFL
jgi:hypothetical protein